MNWIMNNAFLLIILSVGVGMTVGTLSNVDFKRIKISKTIKMKNVIKSIIAWTVITVALYLSCSVNSSTFDWFKWVELAKVLFGVIFTGLATICIAVAFVEVDKKQ